MAQLGSIDLTVVVPEQPATTTVPLRPGRPADPGAQQGRPPGLAFTGIDAWLLLLVAVALVAAGIALHRVTRRPVDVPPPTEDQMPRTTPPHRRLGLLAALTTMTLLCLVTAATAQQSVEVNLAVGTGTRTLSVTDIAGGTLTSVTVRPGQATDYRVAVADANYVADEAFTVVAEQGNLYRVTDAAGPVVDLGQFIASGDVSLGVNPGTATGLDIALAPVYTITENVVTLNDCVAALTGLDAQATTTCTDVLATLDAATVAGLPVTGDLLDAVDLSGIVDDIIRLTPGGSGAFTNPSYIGVGAHDPAAAGAAAATQLPVLRSTPLTDLTALLDDIQTAIGYTDALPVTGDLDVPQVLGGLTTAGQTTLVTQISALSAGAQTALVDLLFDLGLQLPVLDDFSNLTGLYTAFPRMTATPAGGTPAGAYAGTHTVTLLSN